MFGQKISHSSCGKWPLKAFVCKCFLLFSIFNCFWTNYWCTKLIWALKPSRREAAAHKENDIKTISVFAFSFLRTWCHPAERRKDSCVRVRVIFRLLVTIWSGLFPFQLSHLWCIAGSMCSVVCDTIDNVLWNIRRKKETISSQGQSAWPSWLPSVEKKIWQPACLLWPALTSFHPCHTICTASHHIFWKVLFALFWGSLRRQGHLLPFTCCSHPVYFSARSQFRLFWQARHYFAALMRPLLMLTPPLLVTPPITSQSQVKMLRPLLKCHPSHWCVNPPPPRKMSSTPSDLSPTNSDLSPPPLHGNGAAKSQVLFF